MKRLTIPVLLGVLTLFCATTMQPADSWAGDDGALTVPTNARHDGKLVQDTTADTDPWEGDPDTAGDTVGCKKDMMDLLGGVQGAVDDQDAAWLELMIQLLDCFTILR